MEIRNDTEYETNCLDKEMLQQFRKMLSDVLDPNATDTILIKWLRAKNFDLRKSEKIYREHFRARQIHKVDILEDIWEVPEVIQKYEFANGLGFAKDGTPIHYVAMGRGDLRGYILSLDAYDICKYCSVILEKVQKQGRLQSKKLGKEINEATFIIDMAEFSLRQMISAGVIETALDLFRMLQDHYPDIWQHILIVNAPIYFYSAFNLIKPIMRYALLNKIQVVSRDDTPRLLLTYVDADVLPAFLGGNRVDSKGSPMCAEFMKFGATIPEEYYLRNRSPLLPTDEGVEEVWISQKSCYNFPIVIREADSIIRVEFRTEGGSILGSLLYQEFGSDPETIDLPARDEYLDRNNEKCNVVSGGTSIHFQCHMAPINNYLFAPWPGIYIFKFDNTYNWLTSRKLIYRFRVLPPGV